MTTHQYYLKTICSLSRDENCHRRARVSLRLVRLLRGHDDLEDDVWRALNSTEHGFLNQRFDG